jgi:hypothetical protein
VGHLRRTPPGPVQVGPNQDGFRIPACAKMQIPGLRSVLEPRVLSCRSLSALQGQSRHLSLNSSEGRTSNASHQLSGFPLLLTSSSLQVRSFAFHPLHFTDVEKERLDLL